LSFSAEIEKQRLRRRVRREFERARLFGACAVANRECDAVKRQCALSDLQPCATARLKLVFHGLAGLEADAINLSVLMNRRRPIAPVRRNDEHLRRIRLFRPRLPLSVTRSQTAFPRLNPDLQKVKRIVAAGIELAVRHAAACAHQLNLARLERAAVTHAVLVLQRAFEHVAEDLHVAMRMRAETLAGRNAVIVDDTQRAETHVRRVVIIGKGKGVM
jgi:hypothetical protein